MSNTTGVVDPQGTNVSTSTPTASNVSMSNNVSSNPLMTKNTYTNPIADPDNTSVVVQPTPKFSRFKVNPATGQMDKYYTDQDGNDVFKSGYNQTVPVTPTKDTSSLPTDEELEQMIADTANQPLPEGGPMMASLGMSDAPYDVIDAMPSDDATDAITTAASDVAIDTAQTEGAQTFGQLAGKAGNVAGVVGDIATLSDDKVDLGDAKAAANLAQKGAEVAGKEALSKGIGKAVPLLTVAQSVSTLANKNSTDMQKAGAVASAAGAIAMTNFWNPAGWVAGALTIGGTLMQLFGGKSKGPNRSVNIRGHRGGSGYGYL